MTNETENNTPNQNTQTAEQCMTFPCEFPIKAMGSDADKVEQTLRDAVARHCPESSEADASRRESKNGKLTSVTMTVTAQNRKQLDNIYQDLTDSEHITMAL